MARKLKYDIPGTDWRVEPAEVRERGFEGIFAHDLPKPLPLVLEIGFGRGEFLLDLAARNPETAHVGVEYSFKRTLKLSRRLSLTPLRNVRLIEATGEEVVNELLPDASVSALWINFPDPWPKKRHHRRRLIQPAFVARVVRRLVPGGTLRFATDHEGYAEWTDEVLRAEPGLENLYAPERFRPTEHGRLPTAYELEWRALGRSFHFFAYARRGAVPHIRSKTKKVDSPTVWT
jgi:tRNA (guanine-N7-)-methyltransferase